VVFAKWRAVFGGRLKALLCGGAALRAELANFFAAVGIPLMQGYGLTETSAVLCFNRGSLNRAGTVGIPLPGADLMITADGEVLAKGPYIFQGYYRDLEATQAAIDREGWFHTGDLGQVTPDGFLQITGIKKSLFKLVTGKYVMSEPLEQQLQQSPLVQRAIAVGANQKFCGMLIIPNLAELQQQVQVMGLAVSAAELLTHPCILALYQALIDAANCHLPHWSTVKSFRLVQAPTAEITRSNVAELFAADLAAFYGDKSEAERVSEEIAALSPLACPITPLSPTCPTIARSLIH
jgi:long-chain acyl-CoA synthetase